MNPKLLITFILVLIAVACGGSDSPPGAGSSTGGSNSPPVGPITTDFGTRVAAMTTPLPTPTPSPIIGEQVWGQDDCLYVYTGRGWGFMDICRQWNSTTSFTTYTATTPPQKLATIRLDDPNFIYYVDHLTSFNMAYELASEIYYIETDQGWMTVEAFNAAIAEQEERLAREQADRVRQEQLLELQRQWQETQDRVNRMMLAPACASSPWGCGP